MSQQCPHCRLAVQGNDTYQTLRYDPARAAIAALYDCTLEEEMRPVRTTGAGTRSCAGGRQDWRTRLTGLSRAAAVRIQGGIEMKFCTACGEAAHGQRFCTRCGAVLRAQPGRAAGQFQTTTDPGPPGPGPLQAELPGPGLVQLESPGPDPYESGQPPDRPSRPGRHRRSRPPLTSRPRSPGSRRRGRR